MIILSKFFIPIFLSTLENSKLTAKLHLSDEIKIHNVQYYSRINIPILRSG